MIVYRPVTEADTPSLLSLAKKSGIGITTLAKDSATIEKRVKQACDSFAKPNKHAEPAYYWFILEETLTRQPMGMSAIESSIGQTEPFYSYKISREIHTCPYLKVSFEETLLTLSFDLAGSSELCTLFLDADYRHAGIGNFLSKVRFLFIAQFPERFNSRLIAEMRGISTTTGNSPFWNAVGKRFFHLSFKEADKLTLKNKQFIADLMPTIPIYTSLLSSAARAVIGKVHPSTKVAQQILLKEGFRVGDYVDTFDAGPTLEANTLEIKSVKHSASLPALFTLKKSEGSMGMLTNTHCQDFRATLAPFKLVPTKDKIMISRETAQVLGISEGEEVRFLSTSLHDKK